MEAYEDLARSHPKEIRVMSAVSHPLIIISATPFPWELNLSCSRQQRAFKLTVDCQAGNHALLRRRGSIGRSASMMRLMLCKTSVSGVG